MLSLLKIKEEKRQQMGRQITSTYFFVCISCRERLFCALTHTQGFVHYFSPSKPNLPMSSSHAVVLSLFWGRRERASDRGNYKLAPIFFFRFPVKRGRKVWHTCAKGKIESPPSMRWSFLGLCICSVCIYVRVCFYDGRET